MTGSRICIDGCLIESPNKYRSGFRSPWYSSSTASCSNFANLQLLSDLQPEPSRCFHVFPQLPIELRLKIFKHALPEPFKLHLTAEGVVSDPSFGLYITFVAPPVNSADTFWDNSGPIHDFETPKQVRVLSLLATTRESRDLYRSVFRIALPLALKKKTRRKGVLYISKNDVLQWDNLHDPMVEHFDFRTAIQQHFRLQDWWGQIGNIAIPIECFIFIGTKNNGLRCNELLDLICLKMPSLRRLDGVMWKGFQKLQDGAGKGMMKSSMKGFLAATEAALQRHREESDPTYRLPELHLVL